jgi:FtsH-binding integral membrane protein
VELSTRSDGETENRKMSTPTFTPSDQPASRPQTTRIDTLYAPMTPMARMTPGEPDDSGRRIGVGVDQQKLWAGGAASAVVVALLALVGVLVSRWLFNVPVLAPQHDGAYGDVHTTVLILAAVGATLAATGLANLLMLGTLRPQLFFGWIVALVTTIAVAFPFSTTAALDGKIATAIVNLAIGVAIGTLVSGVAGRSIPAARPASGDFR